MRDTVCGQAIWKSKGYWTQTSAEVYLSTGMGPAARCNMEGYTEASKVTAEFQAEWCFWFFRNYTCVCIILYSLYIWNTS